LQLSVVRDQVTAFCRFFAILSELLVKSAILVSFTAKFKRILTAMPANTELYPLFEQLFKDHYNSLANYALSIVKNRQDAEDIVQDVFVKLWQNSPQVVSTNQVKFYLFTATKNTCISLLRKQAGKTFVEPEDIPEQTPDTPIPSADPALFVQQALSLLPAQCLVIFKLSRYGKLTYQQIADELGISVKTVENQMGKALRIMRDFAKKNNISFSLLILFLFPDLMPAGIV
jgi:RNA polymerase sigma-70 factor (family 1)